MADEFAAFRFPVLLGDIGGTNARFALLHAPDAEPVNFPNVATADYPNIDDAIRDVVLGQGGARPRSMILAIAAPVNGEEIALTNSPWVIRPHRLIADLGFEDVVLLNDFEAQSLAISALPESGYARIGGGTALPEAGRVVVGPGTGLGVGALVRTRGIWVPVPGEGGHIDLGPRDERDRAIWPHLQPIAGRISAEQVLSGRGLVNLYRAICRADGAEPRHDGPAAITQGAIARTDRVAGEAVDLFATYLARVAGDLALVFMARGGVFVAGGIFARILPILREREMRAAFEDKAPHSALLAQIPLCVITQPLAALVGLAALAKNPAAYGLETQGRHWSGR